jgi:NAD(P)-dependent dehydrogenase (short-subunit alcohol dehydrogenase family)
VPTRLNELFSLAGKSAIVTGGGTGLGRQMAEGLAEAGASIVLCARKLERCEQAAAELSELGVRAIAIRCDVREQAEIEDVVRFTRGELGSVDILVNNAGHSWGAAPEDVPLEGWQKVIDVNLTGAFLFARAAGHVMIEQGGGKIVNIASIAGLKGAPPEVMNAIPYSVSKRALISLTHDLARQWGKHRINVNAIAPGWFPSDMARHVLDCKGETLLGEIPARRFGGPDDLKGAVVFLASAASDYVTGQTIVVDGGLLAR